MEVAWKFTHAIQALKADKVSNNDNSQLFYYF